MEDGFLTEVEDTVVDETTELATDSDTVAENDIVLDTDETQDVNIADQVPTKFLKDDGTPDYEKLVQSYKELEKGPSVPEAYDDTTFEELNLNWGEGEAAVEWRSEVEDVFKDAKLSQAQFDKIMPLYAKAMENLTGSFGPPVDSAFEQRKLEEAWGAKDSDEYLQRQTTISTYAKTLPPELFKYPLHQTAAGAQLLEQLAKTKAGPKFVSESEATVTPEDLRAEMAELINDPAYSTTSAKGKMLQQKADVIASKLARLR